MKKRYAIKALAFVLALLMVPGIPAAAMESGTESAAADTINITVGEIVSVRKLVEDKGYNYRNDIGNRNVSRVTSSGAVNSTEPVWPESCGVYGTNVGQGSVTIGFFDGTPSLVVAFNVTALPSKPIVKKVSIIGMDNLFTKSILASAGYKPEDIANYVHWDVSVLNGLVAPTDIMYSWTPVWFETGGNGVGESQILYNMKDGQVILINVNIKNSILNLLFEPLVFLAQSTAKFPWNILVFLFTPVDWILNLINTKRFPTHSVTPALVF